MRNKLFMLFQNPYQFKGQILQGKPRQRIENSLGGM